MPKALTWRHQTRVTSFCEMTKRRVSVNHRRRKSDAIVYSFFPFLSFLVFFTQHRTTFKNQNINSASVCPNVEIVSSNFKQSNRIDSLIVSLLGSENRISAKPIRYSCVKYLNRSLVSLMPEIEYVAENALFGKYDLGKLLGCGAFAKVYHARNVQTGQSVAIKVINKKKISGTNLMNNIKREVSIMRRLHHPNIVKLFEVLATRNKIYFVLEYVKGGELFAKVAKGRFTEDLARKYFQQLISAVAFCHARGIFHRDLKPENLLVDENGDLKVSDFGLSALSDQIRSDGLLHTLCGTPAYVAPEILSKKGYDGAMVDVWSCGVVLFVLIAGYLPFNDPNLMAMYKKIYKGEYRCPKWMSPDLKRFLSRLLDINPITRITVDEILRDPWFRKGGFKGIKLYDDDFWCKIDKDQAKVTHLNAFDIISFSSGLDLSGLFETEKQNLVDDGERFVSAGSPEEIVEKVEEIAKAEKLKVMRKRERGVEIGGQNGKLAFGVEVFQLTEDTVVAECRRRGGDAVLFNEFWKNKLRPKLINGCDYQNQTQLQIQDNESEAAQSSSASTSESSALTSAQLSSSASTSGSGNYTTITAPIV